MRQPRFYDSRSRCTHPPDVDGTHAEDVITTIRAADLCEGAVPPDPASSARAMLLAIEDHLAMGQVAYALHHFSELNYLAGSMHRLSYENPTLIPGYNEENDVVFECNAHADQALLLMQSAIAFP